MFVRFFVTLGVVAFWITIPEVWEESKTFLNGLYPNLTFIVLAVLLCIGAFAGIYEYKMGKKNSKNDNKELHKKLYEELKDGIESLDGTLDRFMRQHEINGKKINYIHIYMNHKVFDGYVNSGNFNHVHHELSQPLQDIYLKISIHDDLVKKIVDQGYAVDEDVLTLNKNETELKNEIPLMMKKLKQYF